MSNVIDKYAQVYASPFLVGIFMGINAMKDVALYVDGPDCNFYRSDMVYKTHDINSQLKDSSVNTRLYFSGVMPNKMVRGYDDKIKRKLGYIVDNDNFTLGVITCMPVTGLLATQYNNIYSDLDKDFIFVPSFTDKFWLDGYSILIKEIAKFIKLDTTKKKKKLHISLIGFLFDRNEGDCIGNIEEIKRIMGLIGVTIDSIWLDGGSYKDLSRVEESELIINLPYGKHASKFLSRKLGTEVLELEVPFGLENTINFVNEVGAKLGISKEKLDSVLSSELHLIKEKMDLLDEKRFLNKNFVYGGDPFLEDAIKDIGEFLGMNHLKTYTYNGSKQANIKDMDSDVKIDLVIGNSEFEIIGADYIHFEFGFPSYNTHFLLNRPYMGFRGLLNFVERLYDELGRRQKYK